ncbi:hypothetical protein CF336_g6957, partial [Tilletia laevis]
SERSKRGGAEFRRSWCCRHLRPRSSPGTSNPSALRPRSSRWRYFSVRPSAVSLRGTEDVLRRRKIGGVLRYGGAEDAELRRGRGGDAFPYAENGLDAA